MDIFLLFCQFFELKTGNRSWRKKQNKEGDEASDIFVWWVLVGFNPYWAFFDGLHSLFIVYRILMFDLTMKFVSFFLELFLLKNYYFIFYFIIQSPFFSLS